MTCRLSTDRDHIRTPAPKAPWASRTPNAIRSTKSGKSSTTHDPRYLPDYLGFSFIKWLADCHRDRVTRRIGLPVCELSAGRDCTMRRVLGAILLALCTLASLSIRDAITARAAVGQCKSYANAHHCHAKCVPVTFFRIFHWKRQGVSQVAGRRNEYLRHSH